MTHGLLCGQDRVEVAGVPPGTTMTFADTGNPTIKAVRDALIGAPR